MINLKRDQRKLSLTLGPLLMEHNCTNSTSVNMTLEQYLDTLQEESLLMMMPTLCFLATLGLTGLVGNSLILLVYSRTFRLSPTKFLLMAIAVFDLIGNIGAIPGEMYTVSHYWNFNNPLSCKLKVFVNVFTTAGGAMSLLAVAVTRYRKICVPYAWQLTHRHAQIIISLITFLSIWFSVPYVILYGHRSKPTPCPKIIGSECYNDDSFVNTNWPLINNGLFILIYICLSVPVTILYFLIGIKARKHRMLRERSLKNKGKINISQPIDVQRTTQINASTLSLASTLMHRTERKISTFYIDVDKTESELSSSSGSHCCDGQCNCDGPCKCCDGSSNCCDGQNKHGEEEGTESDKPSCSGGDSRSNFTELDQTVRESTFIVLLTNATPKPISEKTENVKTFANSDLKHAVSSSLGDLKVMPEIANHCKNTNEKVCTRNCKRRSAASGNSHSKRVRRSSDKRRGSKPRSASQITAMLTFVTAVYVISYLFFLVLTVLRTLSPQLYLSMSFAEKASYHLFLRMYYLNCAANSVIYSLWDPNFRQDCLRMISGVKKVKVKTLNRRHRTRAAP